MWSQKWAVRRDSWSRLCPVSPWAFPALGGFCRGGGSRRPPFKLITLCSGEQYGNWSEIWRESTHAHSHTHCSVEHNAAAARAPTAAARSFPQADARRLAPPLPGPHCAQKFPGCCALSSSRPGKQAGRGWRPARSRGREQKGSRRRKSPRVEAHCLRPCPQRGATRRWSQVRTAPRDCRPAFPARGCRTLGVLLRG